MEGSDCLQSKYYWLIFHEYECKYLHVIVFVSSGFSLSGVGYDSLASQLHQVMQDKDYQSATVLNESIVVQL